MKKLLAILLSVIMVLSLVACGNKTQDETPSNDDQQQNTETETKTIKVGLICIGDENDQGYTYNFIRGKEAATEALAAKGINVDWVVKYNIGEDSTCEDANIELAEEGCELIFNNSYGFEPFMLKVAPDYPEIQFVGCTNQGSWNDGLENTHNAFANIYEGRYLAGIAAGLKLNEMIEAGKFTADEAKMGYVGAFTYAEVVSGYTSFFLGARSVCPTVTMDVTFTGSWYDETLEKEGAEKLIQGGCKLISQHADSLGAPTACENAGVPNVSYNGSTKDSCPNTFIVSSRIDWAPYYEMCIKAVMDGTEIPADWTGTLATGSVVLTDVNETAAAAGTAEAIAAATEKLEKGEIHVFDCANFTTKVDDKVNTFKADYLKLDEAGHITSYMADVDTDAAYTGDTEVIKDGYFAESEFRSAPYFDLQIDGINLLDTAM